MAYVEYIVYDVTEDEIHELINMIISTNIVALNDIKFEKIEGSEKISAETSEWLSRVNLYTDGKS